MIILAIIFGIFVSSFVEYLLHRFYLHRPLHDHLAKHHKEYLGDSFTREVSFQDVASSLGYILSNILIYSIIIALIFLFNPNFAFFSLISAVIYTLWVEFIHYEYHSIKKKWFKDTRIFKFLKKHHYYHHQVFNKNYNIGSRIWDVLLKTLKTT
jgi:sterol desaturase/sphingolipid hydroxylase (fatty acid hydroxylase superfamily)